MSCITIFSRLDFFQIIGPAPGFPSCISSDWFLPLQDVDQNTGEDLSDDNEGVKLPGTTERPSDGVRDNFALRNPDRPSNSSVVPTYEDAMEGSNTKKKFKRISSPEKWEIQQVKGTLFELY